MEGSGGDWGLGEGGSEPVTQTHSGKQGGSGRQVHQAPAHALLSYHTSLTKHTHKDKIIKNFEKPPVSTKSQAQAPLSAGPSAWEA